MELRDFHRAILEFLGTGDDRTWIIDPRVWCDGGLDGFRADFENCDADFLASSVRGYHEEPHWTWWKSLEAPEGCDPLETAVAALLPLVRLSRAAAQAILHGIDEGWCGHPEALLPTLVRRAGLSIEDIGGSGSFTPPARKGRWYDHRTWHWRGPVQHVPGKLHFPVPLQTAPLAPGRFPKHAPILGNDACKMLYVSPVGASAAELLPEVIKTFRRAGVDCWLLQYDDAEFDLTTEVKVIRDQGFKWQLALRHLHPDVVADYDFLFFWDDDLEVNHFDPLRFAAIMEANRLEMAQPAIRSRYGLSHAITRHRPCPPPWRDPDGVTVHPVVGRLTNFVEIMAPVFTRRAWREFYSYLEPENQSGWGYDYIPIGRKGIVDAMPVVHTRPVQSNSSQSQGEIRRFLNSQGLFRHAHAEHGFLFEHHSPPSSFSESA